MREPKRPRSVSISQQIKRARARDNPPPPAKASPPLYDPRFPMAPISLAQARKEWYAHFAAKDRQPFPFQEEAWEAFAAGRSGLILSATGSGKSFASLGGPLLALRTEGDLHEIRILYISPLKALVRDIAQGVQTVLQELNWNFRAEIRTGDSTSTERRRQRAQLPHILFTTPESLGLLLTEPQWRESLLGLRSIVIDEWHELLGSKRGNLLELFLARLRSVASNVQTWAVSATLANPTEAAQVLLPAGEPYQIIQGHSTRGIEIKTLLPPEQAILPWFGHRGLNRVPQVVEEIERDLSTTLVFTNTRGQAEAWYLAITALRPAWVPKMGLHHGSMERNERERVENGLRSGEILIVVATSTLDLGVDFPSVEKVIQIGSVKGMSRATQRAGRAFHRPGCSTALNICPTHFLEYVEVAALRRALETGVVEARSQRVGPMDVLVQFVLSSGLNEGFILKELKRIVRSAYSFKNTTEEQFHWILNFVTTGGQTLQAYPQFKKLIKKEGSYVFSTPLLAVQHRLSMGTIVSESTVTVSFLRGTRIGQIDESFITKLKRGDIFSFSGKKLEFITLRNLVAYVKLARSKETVATIWGGHALPISDQLSAQMREILAEIAEILPLDPQLSSLVPEIRALRSVFALQNHLSAIPRQMETLVELTHTRDGHHLYIYTWEGRLVNEGIGHLLAYRLVKLSARTIAVSANDHGFECISATPFPADSEIISILREGSQLTADIENSLNYPEIAKRAFREIAAIAGLIQIGPVHQRKSARHLQMSASLLYDVFLKFDPTHPLLQEAFREVRRSQLELSRLERVLSKIAAGEILVKHTRGITPFSFSLYVERVNARLSTETIAVRIQRLQEQYSKRFAKLRLR